jgi:hypothetical protein
MSKYDNIKTARELVSEVQINGLSTAQEDINRAQDIFGNSTIEELITLANDRGMDDENGNPDPNGSWSSGRKVTQDIFYLIAFSIWNWREATSFYNSHSNPLFESERKAIDENKKLKSSNNELKSLLDYKTKHDKMTTQANTELTYKISGLTAALKEQQNEIITLKAKLYDMITKEGNT